MALIIGTAGHVDHGKSSLIKALTGQDPDRLEEEKRREMTIDLGFAWMQTDSGEIGFVDVPGHSDFIENMLAGIGGIDAALIVIDAEEGIMPQTREHIDIIQLLEISQAIIVITKVDKVDDEWLGMMQDEISKFLSNTLFRDSPVIPVSSLTGEGVEELKSLIKTLKPQDYAHVLTAVPWLPVDRVFSLEGFGTIVTGTLAEGIFHVADEVLVLPRGKKGRIRGIQNYEKKSDTALPGKRTAINLSGVTLTEVHRGDIITSPQGSAKTQLIDAKLSMLSGRDNVLNHNQDVKFFCGSSERSAHVRVMLSQEIASGDTGFVQFSFDEPVAVRKGDRFILRRPSPPETLGGGVILNPHPPRKLRRFSQSTHQYFSSYELSDPADQLLNKLDQRMFFTESEALKESNLLEGDSSKILSGLIAEGRIIALNKYFVTQKRLGHLIDKSIQILDAYHLSTPLLRGIPRESFRQKLGLGVSESSDLLLFLLEKRLVDSSGSLIWKAGHASRYTKAQAQALKQFREIVEKDPANPPSIHEAVSILGRELFDSLVLSNELTLMNDQLFFTTRYFEQAKSMIISHLRTEERLTVSQVRDLLESSRKYVLAILDKMDRDAITKREGDYRMLSSRFHGEDMISGSETGAFES